MSDEQRSQAGKGPRPKGAVFSARGTAATFLFNFIPIIRC
jgi:hypothetical protein